MIVVLCLASHVDQAVDGTASTQGLAPRPIDSSSVHIGVGVCLETPVVLRAPHGLAITDGQVDPDRSVGRPCLQQQDLVVGVFGKSCRENASGRAGADDDVVITCDRI
ncbi:hypothetical protein SDC9_146109 [bioreactor metagenome]|uniref:Uncharacterized protein n=1 Tax=bioreactor metagenome TaxID=1076179 RepID=A0A645EC72_9ZZZZ